MPRGAIRARMAPWMFGPELDSTRPSIQLVLLMVGMVVAGTIVTVLRLPADARNVLWAEDGQTFLSAAFSHDFLTNVFTPYAGYMHLYPRTSAQLVALFAPVRDLGLAMNLFGAAAWSTVAISAFVFTRGRVQLPLRWLLWLLVLLLPIGSFEVATNTANSHWFLIFGLFLALSARSGSLARTIFAAALVAFGVLSDPLALLFVPLVVFRLLWLKGIRENIVSIVFFAAGAVQLFVDAHTSRDRGQPMLDPPGLARAYLVRIVWGTFAGPKTGSWLYYTIGSRTITIVAILLLCVLIALILMKRSQAGLAALSLLGSLGFFAVIGILTWQRAGPAGLGTEVYWYGRYLVDASLLLIVSIVATLSTWLPEGEMAKGPARRGITIVVATLLLVAPGIDNYQTPAYKDGNPQMSTGLVTARAKCEAQPKGSVRIPIGPLTWTVKIPCDRVMTR
jgi:hypothetical protein